ncbi:MAG: hypothetical protein HRT68_04760 [Flavobacteriaceae bacterium]|nr:hypothetical protein [Flavobacteriaceae bacterium]
MSKVTNIILTSSVIENEEFVIKEIEKFILRGNSLKIVSINNKTLPEGWYGGSKHFESNVFIGAYNYLDIKSFINHLKIIKWKDPECVQLFYLEEDDYRFKMISLFE